MKNLWQTVSENFNLTLIVANVALVVGAVVLWRLISRAYRAAAKKRAADRGTEITAITRVTYDILRAVFVVIVVLTLLQMNGVNVGGMLAGLGIASAIVGLALQDMLRDILMGIRIVSDKFFEVGDVVNYNGMDHIVTSYNLRSTKLRALDYGGEMTVCNRNITEIQKRTDLVPISVQLSYDEDFRKVHEVLTEIAAEMAKLDGVKSAEYKGTQSFNDSSITYRIHLAVDMTRKWDIYRAALTLLQARLAEHDITIPYPQLDVHTK